MPTIVGRKDRLAANIFFATTRASPNDNASDEKQRGDHKQEEDECNSEDVASRASVLSHQLNYQRFRWPSNEQRNANTE